MHILSWWVISHQCKSLRLSHFPVRDCVCHGEVSPEPLLLPEQVAADHPLEGPPLGVVVAEAVLQIRLLNPGQAQGDLGVLSGDALQIAESFSNLEPRILGSPYILLLPSKASPSSLPEMGSPC